MNLGTVNVVIRYVAGLLAILAYLYKGMQYNKARNKAQQGRIIALVQVIKFQEKRLTNLATYVAT
jgi:hypothetical protein